MASSSRKYEIDMVNGPLLGKLLLFAVPLVFSGILQLLFNAADIVVVGRFAGAEAIAAVGSTGSIINLIISLFMGLSVGVNVLCARFYAAHFEKDMDETVHTSITLALIGGVVLALIGVIFARPLLRLMGNPDDVIGLASTYMRIYFVGMPVSLLYNFGSAVLRAVGDTRRPLYFLMIAGVLNVVLNLFFVIVLHMDVDGVALATIISQALSAFLTLRCLIRTDEIYRLVIRRLRINKEKLVQIARIGLPAGLQGTLFSFSNTLIQSSVNSFGSTLMAGNAASQNLEGFIYTSMNAIYQASIAFTSQNYGVHNFRRIDRILVECLAIVFVIGAGMGALFLYFGPQLLSIYTSDPQTIEYGMIRLTIFATTYFLCGLMDTACGSIRGMGYGIMPMLVSLAGACGLRIVWILTVFQLNRTPRTLYLSYPISWAITFAVHLMCFFYARRKIRERMQQEEIRLGLLAR